MIGEVWTPSVGRRSSVGNINAMNDALREAKEAEQSMIGRANTKPVEEPAEDVQGGGGGGGRQTLDRSTKYTRDSVSRQSMARKSALDA